MGTEKNNSPSWGVVILLLIVFWPVGIYLLYRKLSGNRDTNSEGGKVLKVVGIVFLILGVIYFIMAGSSLTELESKESSQDAVEALVVVGTVFFVGGVIMLIMAKRKKRKANNITRHAQGNQTQYTQMQFNQESLSERLFREQQLMQQQIRGLQFEEQPSQQFSQIHVSQTIITNQEPFAEQEKPPEKKGPRVVTCKNCGGNNTIIDGEIGECEYCGSPIN